MIANTVNTATWVAEIIKALSNAKNNIVANTAYDKNQLIGNPKKVSIQDSLSDGQSSFILPPKVYGFDYQNDSAKFVYQELLSS